MAAARLRDQAARLRKGLPEAITTGNSKLQNLQAEIDTLKQDLTRREASYVQRENSYIQRIEELNKVLEHEKKSVEERLSGTRTDLKFNHLKVLHNEIMSNLDMVNTASTSILEDQERDLLRAFRSRLFDVQTELGRVKAKKEDGASVWITKAKQLEAEVDWATKAAEDLAEKNASTLETINEMKSKYKCGEEDRRYLLEQLVTVKRENLSLGAEVEAIEKSVIKLRERKESLSIRQAPVIRPRHAGLLSSNDSMHTGDKGGGDNNDGLLPELPGVQLQYDVARLKALTNIDRVKTLLVEQQSSLKKSRQKLAAQLAARTELQRFLKQCLLDIRNQIQFKENPSYLLDKSVKLAAGEFASASSANKSVELLKSQDRVVSLLYHRTFPIEGVLSPNGWSKLGGHKSLQQFPTSSTSSQPSLLHYNNNSNIELTESDIQDTLSVALRPISIEDSDVVVD